MNLTDANKLATALVTEMRSFCHRIEIAGSVRRKKPEVGDIEIVAIPKWEDRSLEGVLFDFPNTVNLLHEAMQKKPPMNKIWIEWIKPGATEIEPWDIKPDGKYWRGLVAGADGKGPLQPIKLDLFLCSELNWGVIFLIRTGSADFSRELVTYARDRTSYRVDKGFLKQNPAHVDFDHPIPCSEESDLFARLGLEYVEPEHRIDGRDIIPLTK